jgi:hypothetical protein
LDYAAVSIAIRRSEGRLREERKLARSAKKAETLLVR